MAEITLRSISHRYTPEDGDVLCDIELSWRDGGAYALLGPSGCGKTTLLNIMSGLIRPTRGRVLYGGKDVTGLSTRQRNIAQVFQFPVIYDTMSVFDNLAFPLRNRGVSGRDIKRRVGEIAELLELGEVLGERAVRLSADMKQIISLGRGLVRDDVAAILFDEPLTVIDPQRKWVLRRTLRAIHRQVRHTLIYVTHDQTEALTFADEVVVMHEGRILQEGTPEALFARPEHTFVGYFIGSPGMSFLPCEVKGAVALVAGHAVPLPAELGAAAQGLSGELGIRPEHVALAAEEEAASEDPGVPVRVERVEDHGRFCLATAALGNHRIAIKLGPGAAVAPGEERRIRFPAEHLCLYRDGHLVAKAAS